MVHGTLSLKTVERNGYIELQRVPLTNGTRVPNQAGTYIYRECMVSPCKDSYFYFVM